MAARSGPAPRGKLSPAGRRRISLLKYSTAPGGQAGVLDRVLRAYQASLTRYLAEVVSEPVASDPERLARAAHTLKSSSAAVGAMGLAQHCADIEGLVRSHKTLPPPAQVEAMIHEGRLVLAAVGTMLAP